MDLLEEIKKHEGFEPRVYKCTQGYDTIGYGFTIKDLYLENGLRSYFKGYGSTLVSLTPFIAINFGVYDQLKTNLNVDNSGDDTSTGTVWGDEGLTMDQVTIISDEITNITNTTNYNTFALNTNDSEEPCEDCSDGAWIDGVFYEY